METIEAVFKDGKFEPCEATAIPDGTRVLMTLVPKVAEMDFDMWYDMVREQTDVVLEKYSIQPDSTQIIRQCRYGILT